MVTSIPETETETRCERAVRFLWSSKKLYDVHDVPLCEIYCPLAHSINPRFMSAVNIEPAQHPAHKTIMTSNTEGGHTCSRDGLQAENPHRCSTYDSCLPDVGQLLVHDVTSHNEAHTSKRGVTCTEYSTEDSVDTELRGFPSECVVCGQTFQHWRALRKHMASHDPGPTDPAFFRNCRTADGKMQCMICGVVKTDKRSLRYHFASHTTVHQFICPKCPASFKASHRFITHFTRAHTSLARIFRCELCDFTTLYRNLLHAHRLRHDGIVEKERCEVCFQMFGKEGIRYHYFRHTGEKPHVCKVCGKGYSMAGLLKKHIASIHLGIKRVREHRDCQVCGANMDLRNLETHMRRHTGEPTNTCCVCGRHFFSLRGYVLHMERMHVRKKDRECPVCEKSFHGLSQLHQHMHVHVEEKLFKCEVCGKAFRWKHKVGDHMKTHSEERPFKCELCGEAFKWKHNLANHVRAKHK